MWLEQCNPFIHSTFQHMTFIRVQKAELDITCELCIGVDAGAPEVVPVHRHVSEATYMHTS